MDSETLMERHGLTREELLDLALDYISNQQSDDAFDDHLRQAKEGNPLL